MNELRDKIKKFIPRVGDNWENTDWVISEVWDEKKYYDIELIKDGGERGYKRIFKKEQRIKGGLE